VLRWDIVVPHVFLLERPSRRESAIDFTCCLAVVDRAR
jgi:hypothetical protein